MHCTYDVDQLATILFHYYYLKLIKLTLSLGFCLPKEKDDVNVICSESEASWFKLQKMQMEYFWFGFGSYKTSSYSRSDR